MKNGVKVGGVGVWLDEIIEVLGATYLGALHPYQFFLDGGASQKLLEVYTYEWN